MPSTVNSRHLWSYDAAGQLLEQSSPDGSVVYSYDLTGQLTGADWDAGAPLDDESYDYDLSGNRTEVDGTAYTTGDRNRTTFDGTYHYTYDQRGNRTARFQWDAALDDADSDGEIDDAERRDLTEYTFDALGHLTRVETTTEAVDYICNFEGLRVARHVDTDLDGTRDHSEYFSYGPAGNDVLLDFVDPDGEATASAAELAHRYVWNPAAVDQLLAQENIDPAAQDTDADGILDTPGDTVYPLSDHLHTNRDWAGYDAQTQTTTIVAHVVIDSFGTPDPTASTGLGPQVSHYLYTSQEWDPQTGLHYYDARWYDPRIGKFVSEDPIGFEAGDANLCRYVGNNALNTADPSGLAEAVVDLSQRRDAAEAFTVSIALPEPLRHSLERTRELRLRGEAGKWAEAMMAVTPPSEWTWEVERYIRPIGSRKSTFPEAIAADLRKFVRLEQARRLQVERWVEELRNRGECFGPTSRTTDPSAVFGCGCGCGWGDPGQPTLQPGEALVPNFQPGGPSDVPDRLKGTWRISLVAGGGHAWIRFENTDTGDVHTVGNYAHGFGGRYDAQGNQIVPPVAVSGLQWDQDMPKDKGFKAGIFPYRSVYVEDPEVYKDKTPYSYSELNDNCATYARDAWYYYSGEWRYLPGPDLPGTLENWIREKNDPLADELWDDPFKYSNF